MIPALGALLVGIVIGGVLAPQLELAYWRVKRDVLAWRHRRRQPAPGWRLDHGGPRPAPQEGPPTRRCRYTDARRGRCLNDRDHLGDHLLPADLGL